MAHPNTPATTVATAETDQGPHEQLVQVVPSLAGRAELRCAGEKPFCTAPPGRL